VCVESIDRLSQSVETFTTFARGIGQGQPRRSFDEASRASLERCFLRRTGSSPEYV